jgi:DNA-binding response OmpR family regulator
MAKRIVIIEDDPNILELLVYLFESEGYKVNPFATGRSADEIGLLMPDVVILDVSLVGSPQRGDQICSEIKKLLSTSKLPVILLSAEKDLESIAKNCFADAFIGKPFDIDDLVNKAAQLCA